MKYSFLLFLLFISTNAFALYTETIPNVCMPSTQLHAEFDIAEYTCSNGYFLPKNATSCQACPVGATCNGGTFYFNETKPQGIVFDGIVTQTASNSCNVRLHRLNAIFDPIAENSTVINLNYDDGSGNITEQICIYGEEILLPPNPSRPGYQFKGWRLKSE